MTCKFDAIIGYFDKRGQRGGGKPAAAQGTIEREYLIAAAVGEYGAVPAHKFVDAAEPLDRFGAGSEHQMVGVGQNDICAAICELSRGDALYGACSADGHKYGRWDLAMGGNEKTTACR